MRHRVLTHFVSVLVTGLIILVSGNADAWFPHGGWVLPGASADLDFADSLYYPDPVVTNSISTTRASTGYAQWADGHLSLFAANAPRITDQGLLVEEARTNVITQSQAFSAAVWPSNSGLSSSDNNIAAPDGITTGSLITTTATGAARFERSTLFATSSTYAVSLYAKAGTASFVGFGFFDGTTDNYIAFNLGNGTVGTNTGTRFTSPTITAAGNGWYRITALFATPASFTGTSGFKFLVSNNSTISNNTAIGVTAYYWGAQGELGSFSTSYIPTTTVAVTRAADSVNLTTAAGSVISSLQGSLRVETFALQQDGYIVSIDSTNSRFVRSSAASQMHSDFTGTLLTASAGSGNRSGSMKTSLGWNASGRSLVVNNGILTSDSAVPSSLSASGVYLGSNTGVNGYGDGYIKRVTAWTSRLSDTQLQALTQ